MKLALLKRSIHHLFSLVVIIGLGYYLWLHRSDINEGLSLSAWDLFLLTTLVLTTWVLNSLPMLVFSRLMGLRLGFWENLSVLIASMLANYLPMRVGTLIRMRFFKLAHDLDYMSFVGIMILRMLLLLVLSGLLGIIGLTGLAYAGQDITPLPALAFLSLLVLGLVGLLVPIPEFAEQDSMIKRLLGKLAACHAILRTTPRAIWLLALISFAQFIVLALRLYISFEIFGITVSSWLLLLIGPLATLITFINLTPGNLGIREWVIGVLAGVTGLNIQNGIFAGTLDRAVLMVLTFTIGPACLYYTLRRTNSVGTGNPP